MANLPVVTNNPIPTFKQPIVDDDKNTTRPWYFFFQSLYNNILKPTGVTPGSYTNTNLTVNANGVITSASSGSGGGVTQLVAGTNVTLSPPSGTGVVTVNAAAGASLFNITVDSHPTVPTGVGLGPNDEFEFGSTIDTSGSRYSGATGWVPFNLGTGSTAVSNGALLFTPQVTAGVNCSGYVVPVPGSGTWTYTAKIAGSPCANAPLVGMILSTSAGATGKLYMFGITQNAVGTGLVTIQQFTNATTFTSSVGNGSISGGASGSVATLISSHFYYLKISFDGTNLIFSVSTTGQQGANSFVTNLTVLPSAFLGTPGLVGLGVQNQGSLNIQLLCDWFRRTA